MGGGISPHDSSRCVKVGLDTWVIKKTAYGVGSDYFVWFLVKVVFGSWNCGGLWQERKWREINKVKKLCVFFGSPVSIPLIHDPNTGWGSVYFHVVTLIGCLGHCSLSFNSNSKPRNGLLNSRQNLGICSTSRLFPNESALLMYRCIFLLQAKQWKSWDYDRFVS